MIRNKLVREDVENSLEVLSHVVIICFCTVRVHRTTGRKVRGRDEVNEVVQEDMLLAVRRRITPKAGERDEKANRASRPPLISLELSMCRGSEVARRTLHPGWEKCVCDVFTDDGEDFGCEDAEL